MVFSGTGDIKRSLERKGGIKRESRKMTPANLAGQFGDTTYTKVFVGGLAWETQKETMKKYFEQFGEILEAVVITDKATGRSKGYGFVCPSLFCFIYICFYPAFFVL